MTTEIQEDEKIGPGEGVCPFCIPQTMEY